MNYYSDEEYQEDLKDAREYEERKLKIEQEQILLERSKASSKAALEKRKIDEARNKEINDTNPIGMLNNHITNLANNNPDFGYIIGVGVVILIIIMLLSGRG